MRELGRAIPLAQHLYNATVHEGLGYSPHKVVFRDRARTPSSFPPREELLTYSEYLADATQSLAQLRTLAAMNFTQAKYKSKFYYDQKQNTQHFCEGKMVYLMKKSKHGKIYREYVGPCEIIEINNSTHNAKIQKGEQMRTLHLNLLKRSYELPKGSETRELSINE